MILFPLLGQRRSVVMNLCGDGEGDVVKHGEVAGFDMEDVSEC